MDFLTNEKLTIVGAAGMITQHGADRNYDASHPKHLFI